MPRGPKGERRPADVVGAVVMVGRIATGDFEDTKSAVPERAKGGKIGGQNRAKSLTPEQRREISTKAANSRWKKDL